MAEPKFLFGATFISGLMIVFFLIYFIMIYPSERATALNQGSTGADIIIKNMQFTPAVLEINRGEKVTWRNMDDVKHDISFAEFSSGTLNPGESYSYTFNKTGTYVYSCAFYTSMTGTIIVK